MESWQQIIKKLPLMVAYANKAVVIIWGLLWGCLFFGETVTPGKLTGITLGVIGVVLFATSESGDAAGYILVTIFGFVFFKEQVTGWRFLALTLIISGIFVYALLG